LRTASRAYGSVEFAAPGVATVEVGLGLPRSVPCSRVSGPRDAIIVTVSHSVLLVDDDIVFRALARRVLTEAGLDVAGEAGTVAEAIAAAHKLTPSAALVDIQLPDGCGLTLARELHALPWHPRVVLTSIDADAVDHQDVVAVGAVAFVPKSELLSAPLGDLLRSG
jgi:CheY-like chemotaxis protein